jgi:hypothetical protein
MGCALRKKIDSELFGLFRLDMTSERRQGAKQGYHQKTKKSLHKSFFNLGCKIKLFASD